MDVYSMLTEYFHTDRTFWINAHWCSWVLLCLKANHVVGFVSGFKLPTPKNSSCDYLSKAESCRKSKDGPITGFGLCMYRYCTVVTSHCRIQMVAQGVHDISRVYIKLSSLDHHVALIFWGSPKAATFCACTCLMIMYPPSPTSKLTIGPISIVRPCRCGIL